MIRDCIRLDGYTPGKSIEEVKKELGLKKVVKLASNENPYGASPKAVKAFKAFSNLHIYPDPGYEELRCSISEYTGWEVERIVVGAGIDGILETIFRLTVGEGDEVLIPVPTFPYYHTLAKLFCAREVIVERQEDFSIGEDVLEKISPKTKLVLICNPNNPTGNIEKEEVVRAIAESFKGLVVVDEAYIEFADTRFDLDLENVVVTRTFSKAFGLANLRIGYARMSDHLVKAFKSASTPFPISTAAERAAIAALEDKEWLKFCVSRIRSERERMYKELSRLVKVYPSQANFLFFATPIPDLADRLLKKGIIVRDCRSFTGCGNHIRVSVGKPEENDLFLRALQGIMEEWEERE